MCGAWPRPCWNDIDHGHPWPTGIDYSVTAWSFGDDLAMVFLAGEVVVDYALRLKRRTGGGALGSRPDADDVPCYIVGRRRPQGRRLRTGSLHALLRLAHVGASPAVEDRIVNAAKSLLPQSFLASAGHETFELDFCPARRVRSWVASTGGRVLNNP